MPKVHSNEHRQCHITMLTSSRFVNGYQQITPTVFNYRTVVGRNQFDSRKSFLQVVVALHDTAKKQ